jgi:hypothetical protein
VKSPTAKQSESVRFAKLCRAILRDCGFTIDGEQVDFAEAGVTVDLVATNRRALSFYILCHGSYHGRQPGLQRTATLKQALAAAHALHAQGWGPVLVLTSHLPRTRGARALLAGMDPEVLFEAIDVLRTSRRLRWLANADEATLRRDLDARRALFLQNDCTAPARRPTRTRQRPPPHTERPYAPGATPPASQAPTIKHRQDAEAACARADQNVRAQDVPATSLAGG